MSEGTRARLNIKGGPVTVYRGPGTLYPRAGLVNNGDVVRRYGAQMGGFTLIATANIRGYVASKAVKFEGVD